MPSEIGCGTASVEAQRSLRMLLQQSRSKLMAGAGDSSGGAEKSLDSGCILLVRLTSHSDRMDRKDME